MGRPLKIQKYSTGSGDTTKNGVGVAIDQGFNSFANLDPGTAVIPVTMANTEFLGVVGGANVNSSASFPVIATTANVNGVNGAAYILRQKGDTKFLVAANDTVTANLLTQNYSYIITSVGTTNWTLLGASKSNPAVGDIFTCSAPIGTGSGTGTASDVQICALANVANTANLAAGQMQVTFTTGTNTGVIASKITNKYVFDYVGGNAQVAPYGNIGHRYVADFFAPNGPISLANVNITGNAGTFTTNATSTPMYVNDVVVVSGTDTGTGNIVGYTSPSTYYITATNGSTTFTLSNTLGGANVVTNAGNTTGLTFSDNSQQITTAKSGADTATFPVGNGNITLAAVSSYTS